MALFFYDTRYFTCGGFSGKYPPLPAFAVFGFGILDFGHFFLFALSQMLSVAHHLVISLHFTWSLLCLCSLELLQLHKHSTSRFQNQMAPTAPSEVAIFTLHRSYNPLNFIQEVLKNMVGFNHKRMI